MSFGHYEPNGVLTLRLLLTFRIFGGCTSSIFMCVHNNIYYLTNRDGDSFPCALPEIPTGEPLAHILSSIILMCQTFPRSWEKNDF